MTVTLDKNGTITIRPQNSLEEYALNKWSEDNLGSVEKFENLHNSIRVIRTLDNDDLPF